MTFEEWLSIEYGLDWLSYTNLPYNNQYQLQYEYRNYCSTQYNYRIIN